MYLKSFILSQYLFLIFIEYIFLSYIFSCLFCVFCIVYFPIIYIIFLFCVCIFFLSEGMTKQWMFEYSLTSLNFISWVDFQMKQKIHISETCSLVFFFCYLKCQTENWIPLSQSLLHKGWRFISNGRHLQKYKTQMSYLQVWPKVYNSKIQENFKILLANRNLSNRRRIYV